MARPGLWSRPARMNDQPAGVAVPTWIGAWAVRAAVVILGVLIAMFAFSLFGLAKVDSPFHDWSSFALFVGISVAISLLLLIEAYVERRGWVIAEPERTT